MLVSGRTTTNTKKENRTNCSTPTKSTTVWLLESNTRDDYKERGSSIMDLKLALICSASTHLIWFLWVAGWNHQYIKAKYKRRKGKSWRRKYCWSRWISRWLKQGRFHKVGGGGSGCITRRQKGIGHWSNLIIGAVEARNEYSGETECMYPHLFWLWHCRITTWCRCRQWESSILSADGRVLFRRKPYQKA